MPQNHTGNNIRGQNKQANFLEQRNPIARENLKLAPLLKYGKYAVRERPLLRERRVIGLV
jgi:hypothetical protein